MNIEKKHFIKNKLQIIQTSLELLIEQNNNEDNEDIKSLINIMMYCVDEINKVVDKELNN